MQLLSLVLFVLVSISLVCARPSPLWLRDTASYPCQFPSNPLINFTLTNLPSPTSTSLSPLRLACCLACLDAINISTTGCQSLSDAACLCANQNVRPTNTHNLGGILTLDVNTPSLSTRGMRVSMVIALLSQTRLPRSLSPNKFAPLRGYVVSLLRVDAAFDPYHPPL